MVFKSNKTLSINRIKRFHDIGSYCHLFIEHKIYLTHYFEIIVEVNN